MMRLCRITAALHAAGCQSKFMRDHALRRDADAVTREWDHTCAIDAPAPRAACPARDMPKRR
jgi:hypothetical protein